MSTHPPSNGSPRVAPELRKCYTVGGFDGFSLGASLRLLQRACAAFLASFVRCALDVPLHRALPPLERFSSGHSWPHFGHLFISRTYLGNRH
jgi:hypothetical protein